MSAILKKLAYEENGAVLRFTLDVGAARPLVLRVLIDRQPALETLTPGRELDAEMLDTLQEENAHYEAHLRALRLLAYSDHSARALTRKLRQKGIDPETAAATAAEMCARGYIREDEQAYRLAVGYANVKRYGRRRVLAALVDKGYTPDTARAAVRRAEEEGEIDFPTIAAGLVEDKLGTDPDGEEKRKLLWKHGF